MIKSPSGNDVADTTKLTPSVGYAGGPYAQPVIGARVSGSNTLLDGKITSGSMLGFNAGAGGASLLWKTPSGATMKQWKMNSLSAAQDAITNILQAQADEVVAATMAATGVLTAITPTP